MAAVIQLKDLTKTYRLGDEVLNALDNVSFTVQAGEFVAITGPSGSGKSTLANIIGLLAGLYPARRAAKLDPVEALRYE